MKRLLLAILLSLPLSAAAQFNGCPAGFCSPKSTVATYRGPGDIKSGATVWGGLRAYSSLQATGTQKAATVCDVATGTTCSDVNILSTGAFDTATAAALSQCATACNVSKLYDQTGNGNDWVQATNANRPTLTFNCLNTNLPCLTYGVSKNLGATLASAIAIPWSLSAVARRTSATNYQGILGASVSYEAINFNNAANGVDLNTTQPLTGITDNVFHAINGVITNGTSCTIYADGSSASGAGCTSGSITTTIRLGQAGNVSLAGNITEGGIWPSGFNSTEAGNVCHNQITYWGITGTC